MNKHPHSHYCAKCRVWFAGTHPDYQPNTRAKCPTCHNGLLWQYEELDKVIADLALHKSEISTLEVKYIG